MTTREFDRPALVRAFVDVGRRAYGAGKTIEISVYGGSALMLTFDWRASTKDVDATFEADNRPARVIGVSSPDHAFELISKFYPARLISPKTQFGLTEIFETLDDVPPVQEPGT